MGNQSGVDLPRFNRGDGLSASDLNKIVDGLIRRIVGADPVSVRSTGSGVVVALRDTPKGRTLPTGAIPAIITGFNVTDITGPPALLAGTYQVDFYGSGFDSPATQKDQNCFCVDQFYVNSSKQLGVDENVSVFQSGGKNYIITERAFRITWGQIQDGVNPYSWKEYKNYPTGGLDSDVAGPLEVDGGAWEINGFTNVAPLTNVMIVQIAPDDANLLPDGSTVGPTGKARYYFAGPVAADFLVQVMANTGLGGYTVTQVKATDHSVVTGGYSGAAQEDTRSTIIPTFANGKLSYARCRKEGGLYFFWYPLAPCSP